MTTVEEPLLLHDFLHDAGGVVGPAARSDGTLISTGPCGAHGSCDHAGAAAGAKHPGEHADAAHAARRRS